MKKSKLLGNVSDELFVPQTALSLRQQRSLVQFAAAMCFQTWKEAYAMSKIYSDDPGQTYMRSISLQQLEVVARAVDDQLATFPPAVKLLYNRHQQEYMDGKELKTVN